MFIGMRLKAVFMFNNGNVAVCGYDGQQITELQGRFFEVRDRIESLADDQTEWYGWPDPPRGVVREKQPVLSLPR
jgi:hypothetical protein